MDKNGIKIKLLDILNNTNTIKKINTYKKTLETEHKIIQLQAINTFINELSKLTHCDFSILKENITSLDIIEIKKINLYLYALNNSANAWYNINDNNIFIRNNKFYKAIYHELLHMATRVISNNKIIGGFSYFNTTSKKKICNSLNEGYTQLLTDRYFIKSKQIYNLEKHIAKHLELIIGKNTMEKLYFKAELIGLYKELYKYKINSKTITEFFNNVDYVSTNQNKLNIKTQIKVYKKMIKINEFLIHTYLEKMKLIYKNISDLEKLKIIKDYISSLSKIKVFMFYNGLLIDKINLKELENHTIAMLDNKEYIIKQKRS